MSVKPGILKHVSDLFYFFRQTRVAPTYFFLASLCSVLAVFFNLLGLRLLIPFLQGMIAGDFSGVGDRLGVVRRLSAVLPGFGQDSGSYFTLLLSLILVSIVIKSALDYFSALSVGRQIRRADRLIRKQVIERYLGFGKTHFDHIHAVTATDIILNASSGVTGQLRHLHKLLTKALLLAAYFAVMCWISLPLTAIALVVFPGASFLSRRFVENIRALAKTHEASHDQLMQKVMNVISCVPLVKLYAAEPKETEKIGSISDEEIRLEYEMQKKQLLMEPAQDASMMIALVLIASAMALFTPVRDASSVPAYLVFLYVARMAARHVNAFNDFRLAMARSETQLSWLKEILAGDSEEAHVVPSGPKIFTELKDGIVFDNLDFSYLGKRPVLRGVSFDVRKGTTTAIVGPTGAGKTTLVSLLVRFYDCPAGSIRLDGTDIREFSTASLMDHIAFVSQDPLLFNDTLRANITYGLKQPVDEARLASAIKKAQLDEIVSQWPRGLDTVIGDRGMKLSGGEKQRAALARAFLKEAGIFILDEATSALDSKTEQSIQQALEKDLAGKTVIMIAHRLSTIRKADQVIVLDGGRVIERGAVDELLEKESRFQEYWRAQGLTKSLQDLKSEEKIKV